MKKATPRTAASQRLPPASIAGQRSGTRFTTPSAGVSRPPPRQLRRAPRAGWRSAPSALAPRSLCRPGGSRRSLPVCRSRPPAARLNPSTSLDHGRDCLKVDCPLDLTFEEAERGFGFDGAAGVAPGAGGDREGPRKQGRLRASAPDRAGGCCQEYVLTERPERARHPCARAHGV